METESDIDAGERGGRRGGGDVVLYVAFRANDPLAPPSRHVVSAIDVIQFGRGNLSITRARKDGMRCLVVRVPDPLMSTDHGRLLHARGTWILDDPRSKNGVTIRGARTRTATVGFGELFALGHTLCFLARETGSPFAALDVTAHELPAPLPELATFSPAFAAALDRMAHVARTDIPLLLTGETGTGKEVAARALHELSRRRGNFVAVNCGGIASTLVESELFGHRRGAFSGAATEKLGYIRTADQGTLFLDEIGELPLAAQAALLRVLQEREVVPVGDALPVPVDFRLCAATHRDLAALVRDGKFREDLYARLLGVTIPLPPLRERRADLGILIPALLRRLPRAERIKLAPAAAIRLFEYAWPRNVRELERVLSVMVALAGDEPIRAEHVPADLVAVPPPTGDDAADGDGAAIRPAAAAPGSLSTEDDALRQRLLALLEEHDHNLSEVARRLGKDRTQIYRWVRRFGIAREGGS